MGSSPAYAKYPNHSVELTSNASRETIEWGGETIADSGRCWLVVESRHDPVLYFPRDDVKMELLEKVEETSFCPFKGTASYYSIRVGDRDVESAVWSYEDPYDEVSDLRDYLAFYMDRLA